MKNKFPRPRTQPPVAILLKTTAKFKRNPAISDIHLLKVKGLRHFSCRRLTSRLE